MKKSHRILKNIFKLLFICAALFFLIRSIDYNYAWKLLQSVSPLFFGIAVFTTFLDQVIMGLKWNVLLKIFDINVQFWVPVIAYLRGRIFTLIVPSILGIDGYKTYYLMKHGAHPVDTISSIFVERFIGALSSLGIIFLLLHFSLGPFSIPGKQSLVFGGFFVFILLCIGLHFLLKYSGISTRIKIHPIVPVKIREKLNTFIINVAKTGAGKKKIWLYFFLSIVEKISYGTVVYFTALSIGLTDFSYWFIIAATPLLALLERLPISIAAIGVREGLFVVLFRVFYADPTIPLMVAFLIRLVEIIQIILLLFVWFGKKEDLNFKRSIDKVEKNYQAIP